MKDAPRYNWQLHQTKWSKCNSICSGKQYLRPICVETAIGHQVSDSHCAHLDTEGVIQQRSCNTYCQLVWSIISKGPCSSHCKPGYVSLGNFEVRFSSF